MASIFTDPRFLPYLQATPMSGRIADPVSLFTRYVPPVVEEEPEEEEVAQATVAPVAPVYYRRPQPVDGGDGYDMPVQQPTGSGNFFTDLKGLVSPITDLFTTSPEVTSTAIAPVAYDPSQDFGPFATGPALQSAPISPVEVSDFPAPVGLQVNPALTATASQSIGPQIDNLTPSDPMAAADDASYRSIDQTLSDFPLGSRGPAFDSLFDLREEFNNPIDPVTASEDYTRDTFRQAGLDFYRMGDEGLTPEQQQRVESGELAYNFYDPALQKQIDEFQTLQDQMDFANFERANEPLNASSRKVEDRALAHTLSLLNDRASVDPVAAAALQEELAREAPLNAFTTAELNQFNSPFSPNLPGAMTMDMASNQNPVDAAVAAPQTGQVDPATVGVTDPVTGVTTYGDQFMTAPAPDPYEASMLAGAKGLFGYPDERTYADGRFNALGEDTTRKGYEQDDKMRGSASKVGAFVGPNIMGPIFGGMIAGSRIGAVEGPYGRDGAGNYRFNAAGPMGTLQSPYGSYSSALGDYTGLYGLGTVGNTGRSITGAMFTPDGQYKAGAHGYGLGFKADGSFGSLDMFDVQDVDAIYENTTNFSFNPDDQGGGGNDGGGGTLSGDDSWSGIDGYL